MTIEKGSQHLFSQQVKQVKLTVFSQVKVSCEKHNF